MGSIKFLAKKQSEQSLKKLNLYNEIMEKYEGEDQTEKKEELISMIEEYISELEKTISELTNSQDKNTPDEHFYNDFWSDGDVLYSDNKIILRKPITSDKGKFLALRKTYSSEPDLFDEEGMQNTLWSGHIASSAIMCSVADAETGDFIGYCGIKDTANKKWEIAIELLDQYHNQGIGTLALSIFLDLILKHCGVNEFSVIIEPDNYASQALFEKLGAKPSCIKKFLIYDDDLIRQCEEEHLTSIDDKLTAVAGKFGVEPRSLLSHVLEYELTWQNEVL